MQHTRSSSYKKWLGAILGCALFTIATTRDLAANPKDNALILVTDSVCHNQFDIMNYYWLIANDRINQYSGVFLVSGDGKYLIPLAGEGARLNDYEGTIFLSAHGSENGKVSGIEAKTLAALIQSEQPAEPASVYLMSCFGGQAKQDHLKGALAEKWKKNPITGPEGVCALARGPGGGELDKAIYKDFEGFSQYAELSTKATEIQQLAEEVENTWNSGKADETTGAKCDAVLQEVAKTPQNTRPQSTAIDGLLKFFADAREKYLKDYEKLIDLKDKPVGKQMPLP